MRRTTLLVTVLSLAVSPALARPQDWLRHVQANFDRVDVNGDDVISRAEFRNLKVARWPQIDRNGDGYLSEEDFPYVAARRARAKLAEIDELDANEDGRISQDEFLDGPNPLFDQADLNSDGVLTRSEVDGSASWPGGLRRLGPGSTSNTQGSDA